MINRHTGDGPVWEDAECDEETARDGIPYLQPSLYLRETEYKQHLIALLEEYGWSVDTEVYADGSRYSIDIIAEHPAVGCVGIEVKRTHKFKPKSLALGIAQLLNYRSLDFSGYDVDYWVLAPGFDSEPFLNQGTTDQMKQTQIIFLRVLVELKFGMIRREQIYFGNYQGLRIPLRYPERLSEDQLDEINEYLAERKWVAGEYEPR